MADELVFQFATKMRKRRKIEKNRQEAYERSLEEWVAFWRENPHRFVQDYFQIQLKDFQEVILLEFSKNRNNIMIATRGIGKSFLTALYACAMAVLYPNSKIVVVCGVKAQAKSLISEKIEKELCSMSLMLRREILEFKSESETKSVIFKNGSTITATNAHENRRGLRATILIVDEAVQVEKNILEAVCLPFLNATRRKGYMNLPEYRNKRISRDGMENQVIYLTSAWFKAHYFFEDYYKTYIKEMIKGGNVRVFNFCERTSLRTNLITEERIEDLKRTLDFMTYQMEVESIFYGENDNSFFKANEINDCRVLLEAYYPLTDFDYIRKKATGTLDKVNLLPDDEFRILSADIAVAAGKQNDNSIYMLLRVSKSKKDDFTIILEHVEAHNGLSTEAQSVRIKQLFYDSNCSQAIIDANGVGWAVCEALKRETEDNNRDKLYPQWGAYNEEGYMAGTIVQNIHYVLYAMKASVEVNHQIALQTKDLLLSKRLSLPTNENEARYYLEEVYSYSSQDAERRALLIQPFSQTTLLFSEMVDLDYTLNKGKIQIKEQGGNRKDRYSALGYGVYLAHEIIRSSTKKKHKNNFLFLV